MAIEIDSCFLGVLICLSLPEGCDFLKKKENMKWAEFSVGILVNGCLGNRCH